MTTLRVYVEGIGLWSPQLANFAALKSLLNGTPPPAPPARPTADTLPANERRRAPESVLLAVEVAAQAVAMSARDAGQLACVFSSGQGDQAVTDYMCATLARAPTELSPTRFHNSVHNAPVGYWTIATHCRAPSTAVCAQRASFGAGLLEAASQVLADQCPVLMTCSDVGGYGPIAEVICCTQSFGCALVLAPAPSDRSIATLELHLTASDVETELAEPLASWRDASASGSGLTLLVALARGGRSCQVRAGAELGLHIDLENVV
ncbi:MAG: beta-ketoacyl synthase chain length factor [Rhodanobacter sp.]